MCVSDSNYKSCKLTYVTLRILGNNFDPAYVTKMIGLEPTYMFKGTATPNEEFGSGWFFSSRDRLTSRDVRDHINWIFAQIQGKEKFVNDIIDNGNSADVFCYWLSAEGQGGPEISVNNMKTLVNFGMSIGFDIYFIGDD